jgi:hypothetical protein
VNGKIMLLQPKNWAVFQHYKDRCPPWIKLHRDLLNDRVFMCLPLASKALAPLLWLLASESKDGTFDGSLDELVFRLHITPKDYEDGLKPLIHKGFFVVASGVLAECYQDAIPETEREGETERETKTEQRQKSNRGSRLPVDFVLPEDWISFCQTERKDLVPAKVFEEFKDYWTALPAGKGTKADWTATWRNWVRRQSAPKQSFAQQAADIARTTVPAQHSGPDPVLLQIAADRQKAAPMPAHIRQQINQVLRKV